MKSKTSEVFIFDHEIVKDIIKSQTMFGYELKDKQELFAKIHEQTNGKLLTKFNKLIFIVQNPFCGQFDVVEADLTQNSMKGKENCLITF